MALNGSLDDYSPAGALRVLSSTGKTGAVRFTGRGGCTVYLNEGQLYFARGEGTDDALATALVRPGRVGTEAWSQAVDDAGDAPRVGELLVAGGAIDADLMASVVLSVIYDPLITLFREGDGRFDFEPDTMHWIGPSRCFDVEAVVNEVRRRVRVVDEMSEVVPSTSAWVSPVRTLPDGAAQVTLLREDWELIASLSGPRTVEELATAMGRGRYSTAAVVHRLAVAGLLDVVPEPFATDEDGYHEPSAAERMGADPFATDAPASGADVADDTAAAAVDEVGGAADASEPADGAEVVDASDAAGAADDRPGADRFAADAPIDLGDGRDTTGFSDAGDAAWESWTSGNPFEHPVLDDEPDVPVSFGPAMAGSAGPEAAPDDALLPRRTAVREADPAERERDLGGLAGIAGFHDPTADVLGRTNEALADATSEATTQDPNAAWLENLYAQFIDDAPESNGKDKNRKKEALDVAFQAPEQAETEKVGTLKRLAAALRRL